jgi:hypothetical protein
VYVTGYGNDIVGDTTFYDWWIKKFDKNGVEDSNWEKKIDGGSGAARLPGQSRSTLGTMSMLRDMDITS